MQKLFFLFLSIVFFAPAFVFAQNAADSLFDKNAAAGSTFAGLEVGGARKKNTQKTNEFDYSQIQKNTDDKKKKSSLIVPSNQENVSSEQSGSDFTASTDQQSTSNSQTQATAPSIEPKETQDIEQQLQLEAIKEEQQKQQQATVAENPAAQLNKGAMSPEYYKTLVDQVNMQTEKTADYNVYKSTNNPAINNKVTLDNRF